jgi:hypothetical protein
MRKYGILLYSNLIMFDPIYSTSLIQFEQIYSNLIKFDPIYSTSLIQFEPIYSNLIKFDQFDQV